MTVDVVLSTWYGIARGLVVNDGVIAAHVARELPFMATENILMEAVKAGGDRQALHEVIRQASHEAAARVKSGGGNDLLERLAAKKEFAAVAPRFAEIAEASRFTGRSAAQVEEFLAGPVKSALERLGNVAAPEVPQV